MAEPFGGVYSCTKNKKHKTGMWFFDSKPTEHRCPRCDDGTMSRLTHVKDYGAGGRANAEKRSEKKSSMP